MWGSQNACADVIRALTSTSAFSATIVASVGTNARTDRIGIQRAYDEPENGVLTATIEAIRPSGSCWSMASFPISPPLLCATRTTSRRSFSTR